jgi:hypothetical protein
MTSDFAVFVIERRGHRMRGGVFICYRREDTAGFAGRIYDRLTKVLGRESVFIDVDNIPAGRDFVEVLTERVGRCDALIALIGKDWLASADKNNRRRLDDANDFVRIEIEAALERNIPVIPVLVDGAVMPQAPDLPDPLQKLARRQGIEISHNRFDSDAERLTDALRGIDGDKPGAVLGNSAAPPPKRAAGGARWLAASAIGLLAAAAAMGIVYEQRRAHDETARQEEKSAQAEVKPTSDILNALPTLRPTSALNAAAPALNADVPAAAPPAYDAPNAAAPDPSPPGKIADSPPAKIGKAVTPEPSAASRQWMNLEDFLADYRRQINWSYPDKAWGRCQNGVPQRGAHWSPRPAGQYFDLHGTNDKTFRSDAAGMTARGFKMQYDNVFQDCDGSMHHQTLWMKEG